MRQQWTSKGSPTACKPKQRAIRTSHGQYVQSLTHKLHRLATSGMVDWLIVQCFTSPPTQYNDMTDHAAGVWIECTWPVYGHYEICDIYHPTIHDSCDKSQVLIIACLSFCASIFGSGSIIK